MNFQVVLTTFTFHAKFSFTIINIKESPLQTINEHSVSRLLMLKNLNF